MKSCAGDIDVAVGGEDDDGDGDDGDNNIPGKTIDCRGNMADDGDEDEDDKDGDGNRTEEPSGNTTFWVSLSIEWIPLLLTSPNGLE